MINQVSEEDFLANVEYYLEDSDDLLPIEIVSKDGNNVVLMNASVWFDELDVALNG